ncbi:MAG: SPOR domain-containing protein [Bacteroidales bacterium]|nr:SPOR domain-containing protein [Bacteroidales bacterium]
MITNYLIELLKDNECVIVPDFGAFISKRHSATIDYANHRFMPPYKELVFNNKLTNNDDLLVNFISQKENISNEEALAKIQNFVNQSAAILDVNFELDLEGLGKLRNFHGDYVFETKEDVNLLGDAFGLTSFNFQPIFRTETYQVIKEKIVVEQKQKNTEYSIAIDSVEEVASETPSRRKPSLFRTFAYTTLAFLFIFVINWTTDKSDSQLASWNPFLYSSPNEYLIKVLEVGEELEVSEVLEEVEATEEIEVVEVTEEIEVVEVTEEIEVTEVPEILNSSTPEVMNSSVHEFQNSYYIVGGSFQTEASAEKCVNDLRNQGFENASSLERNNKGNIRVYYESFAEKADALIRLDEIKRDYNESAWLLFQK